MQKNSVFLQGFFGDLFLHEKQKKSFVSLYERVSLEKTQLPDEEISSERN